MAFQMDWGLGSRQTSTHTDSTQQRGMRWGKPTGAPSSPVAVPSTTAVATPLAEVIAGFAQATQDPSKDPASPRFAVEARKRAVRHLADEATSCDIYINECARHGVRRPNRDIVRLLKTYAGPDHELTELNQSGVNCYLGTLRPLHDILMLNKRLRLILLQGCGLQDADCLLLRSAVRAHTQLRAVDISRNPMIGPKGGDALLRLLQANPHIWSMRTHNTTIPMPLRELIAAQQDTNWHRRFMTVEEWRRHCLVFNSTAETVSLPIDAALPVSEIAAQDRQDYRLMSEELQNRIRGTQSTSTQADMRECLRLLRDMHSRVQQRVVVAQRKWEATIPSAKRSRYRVDFIGWLAVQYPLMPSEELMVINDHYTRNPGGNDGVAPTDIARVWQRGADLCDPSGALPLQMVIKALRSDSQFLANDFADDGYRMGDLVYQSEFWHHVVARRAMALAARAAKDNLAPVHELS
eukprot:TRINITY_DN13100_c0_g1_i1.p1 TRINITY_DN13100_c0_g1~~TRINITY_DN13100_c0_g1_i1.p1  ORF type:complete len:494 (+),score=72.62 TRINITY_DN13100_c0_g1_i1:86-1483(+)